jgi:hypothetical protein
MFEVHQESLSGQDIIVLGPYRPWGYHKETGGDGNSYPEHSGRILDVKKGYPRGINYFFNFMAPKMKFGVFATVPSHDPAKTQSGVRTLVSKLAAHANATDATGCLVRQTKIEKLASGGDRSVQVHLSSMSVIQVDLIAGREVALIDDVMTTGNSLLASRKLLLAAGAKAVACFALGRTTY